MELQILARNMDISDASREYIRKKFVPIERQIKESDHTTEGKVEIKREPTRSSEDQIVVQITLSLNGTLLRAEERAAAANTAVDEVVESLEKQVRRFKGKRFANIAARKSGNRESIRAPDTAAEPLPEDEEPDAVETPSGSVVRIKRFPMKPATVEEAATQMELLGHSFFFFLNSETNEHNVLYRRNDGDYTVIEPEPM